MQNKITDEYLSIAAKIFLFDGIPGNERLKNIYECSPCLRMFKSGELISSPNEYIRGLQIIVSGKAIVTAEFEENSTILRMLAKGDVFGAAALFCSEDTDYVSYIRAKGKTSVLLLDADKVERMITGSSKIAENYIKFLSEEYATSTKKNFRCYGRHGGTKAFLYTSRNAARLGRLFNNSVYSAARQIIESRQSVCIPSSADS